MKIIFRFLIPLFIAIGFFVLIGEEQFTALQEKWFTHDLDARSAVVAHSVKIRIPTRSLSNKAYRELLTELAKEESVRALGICGTDGKLQVATPFWPHDIDCFEFSRVTENTFLTRNLTVGRMHIGAFPLEGPYLRGSVLLTVHDMSYVNSRAKLVRRYILITFSILAFVVALMTAWIAKVSWQGWIAHMRTIVRSFRNIVENPKQITKASAYSPILKDLRKLVRDAESRRRARDETLQSWSPKTLKDILHDELSDEQVIIVSNREPFIHKKIGDSIVVQRPASGLVTALEPVMEACSGTWIAHGSGDGDKEVVDRDNKIRVPPENPSYTLRRVWLSEAEEKGYYYGFSNEGLWPLCHIAHTRPIFRSEDYEYYKQINARFADVVVEEAKTDAPVVLIQDYHFALLPRMLRDRLPKAVIITFWHIPWPNPEVFGICPWREELIDGLLGSSILGFHTQFHCNNFLDTVDRFVESRVDREASAISYLGEVTGIKSYPISIEWPPKWLSSQKSIVETRAKIREEFGILQDVKIGVGIDRLDYTKGIIERISSIETFFKKHPEWIGKFTFLQIAAPSRSEIDAYKRLREQVVELAERINSQYGTDNYKPIILSIEHHEPPQVYALLRASDLCYVSSLHDGMNLVAKEFVASRNDEQGVLILSSFTGASRELPEALIVNPYNLDEAAESLLYALTMSPREQRERMRSMRSLVSEFNIYRWAGRMLLDAATIKKRNRFKTWNQRFHLQEAFT